MMQAIAGTSVDLEQSVPEALSDEQLAPRAALRLPAAVWIGAVVIWLALLALALRFDGVVATWVHDSGTADALKASRLTLLWKAPGTFGFTIVVVVVALAAGWLNWRNALFVLLSGVLAGINIVPKWAIGRMRPYKFAGFTTAQPYRLQPFYHGLYGFIHQRDLSFPSGHETSAWALAAAVAVLYPRVSAVFFLLAAAVGVERVLENAHYCGDVVAAVAVASLGCWIAWRIVKPTVPSALLAARPGANSTAPA